MASSVTSAPRKKREKRVRFEDDDEARGPAAAPVGDTLSAAPSVTFLSLFTTPDIHDTLLKHMRITDIVKMHLVCHHTRMTKVAAYEILDRLVAAKLIDTKRRTLSLCPRKANTRSRTPTLAWVDPADVVAADARELMRDCQKSFGKCFRCLRVRTTVVFSNTGDRPDKAWYVCQKCTRPYRAEMQACREAAAARALVEDQARR